MARKINPTEEERAVLRQKNIDRRSELYTIPTSKFNIDQKDMKDAEAPFSQVGSIIDRFKVQSNTTNISNTEISGFDHLYDESIIKELDDATSTLTDTTNNKSSLLDNATSNEIETENTNSNNELVTPKLINDNVTTSVNDTSSLIDEANLIVNNKITDFSPTFNPTTSHVKATLSDLPTSTVSERSSNTDTMMHPLQKYELINSIFSIDKDLSNVEKNFMVCLILEMQYISERISLNSFITKYEFRRATVYQIIPKISNMGLIQIVTDNNPKGSQIDLSILFKRYQISTVLENVTSSDMSLVRNLNNSISNLSNAESDNESDTSLTKLDATKRIMLKNAILFLFKTMMLLDIYRKIEQYNEKSIKLFSSYLLSKDVCEESRTDLLGLALYSSEKAKNPDRVIYYLHSSLENGGIESLQISFKDKAREFLEFANNYFEVDFEEPSLKEIREFALQLSLDPNLSRSSLVIQLNNVRDEINNNIIRLEKIIDSMPEFRK